MKFWQEVNTFDHPWEKITQAQWMKYPNPMNPAVIGVDVVERKVNNAVLHSHRLLSTNFGLPAWVYGLMGSDQNCYVSEYSEVDLTNKTLLLKSKNLSLCNYLTVDEKLTYSQHPTKSNCTVLKHEAEVTVRGIPLSSYLESVLTKTISINASKGRQAMEWVIGKLNAGELPTTASKSMGEMASTAKLSMDEIASTTLKSMDEITSTTKKSLDEITLTTKKSMDDISRVAQKSMDNLQQNFASSSKLPDL